MVVPVDGDSWVGSRTITIERTSLSAFDGRASTDIPVAESAHRGRVAARQKQGAKGGDGEGVDGTPGLVWHSKRGGITPEECLVAQIQRSNVKARTKWRLSSYI